MDEYFPVSDLAGMSDGGNGFDDPVAFTILYDHFHPGFGQEIHLIHFIPHLLLQALLPALSLDLRDCEYINGGTCFSKGIPECAIP
jgi:hypothetical protein